MAIRTLTLAAAQPETVSGRRASQHDDRTGSPANALDRFKAASDAFLSLEYQPPCSPAELLHTTAAHLHRFAASVLACEAAGMERSSLEPDLMPLRALHSRSPFVQRLQTWPRGYPGDFETVEWLCDARNRAPVGTVGWAIEQYALQSPVAQQHRNKVGLQARAILATMLSRPHARVASIGCGGCRDLAQVQDYIPRKHGRFVLVDADAAAPFAQNRLPGVAGRCEFVNGRVPRVLTSIASTGRYDLVIAGGLFDYLPDRWAVATLRAIRTMLAPGGRLLFSNIAAGNPFRVWLEYLAEWRLIERRDSDLSRLLAEAGFEADNVGISRDSSGLAFMIDAQLARTSSKLM